MAPITRSADRPVVLITSRAQWRDWLIEHHGSCDGIWLARYRKGAGPQVSYDEVVEEALCFGWVDSQARTLDDERSALLLTPRRPRSNWSASNKRRVAKLEAEGLMAEAGRAMVALAQATGTWTALDEVEQLIEPDSLRAALDAEPAARAAWDAFSRSSRRGMLEWLLTARTRATVDRRVAKIVSEAAAGRKALG